MEGHIQHSPKFGNTTDCEETKYICGLSTVLVATLQETKDWISHIEHIFCNQLYPNIQPKSKSLQKFYSEARNAEENKWKKKEYNLLLQIEKLELEVHQALEENHSLKLEKENSLNEREEKTNVLLSKVKIQELKIDELEKKLMQKSKEVDTGMELQSKLLELVNSKSSTILDMGKRLTEHEEKTIALLAELRGLEKKVDGLQEELRKKTEEVGKGKGLRESLLKNIELQALEIKKKEERLNDYGKEKKHLMAKMEHLEENVGELQKELNLKTEEFKKGGELQEHEKEKTQILAEVKGLEEKVNEIQINLRESGKEAAKANDRNAKLLKEIEFKASELEAEKKKRRDLIDYYKRLKSQYNFVCTKFGLTTESMLPQNKLEDGSDSLMPQQHPKASAVACDMNKVKNEISISENLEDEKGVGSIQNSSFHSPTFSSHTARKRLCVKSVPEAGAKRSASSWIDTRLGGGHDPHDDFLDTPLENIIGNLNKNSVKEEARDHPIPSSNSKDTQFDDSDDETQDMNVDPNPRKLHDPVPKTGQREIKYVEPVRKKADRENLKGVDCKQCKKFYDAVLPNDDSNKMDVRCEHHDVSRHRYRYVPPLTPEGFWNIGFESET